MAAFKAPTSPAHPGTTFDVIGSSSKPDSIDHLGMLGCPGPIRLGTLVDLLDMGPPLRVGRWDRQSGELLYGRAKAHAIGFVEDLTDDDRHDLEAWVQDVSTRVSPNLLKCFNIDPPWSDPSDRITETTIGRRFSCAGFVLCGYEEALGIQLLDRRPEALPPVDRDLLAATYDERTLGLFDRFGEQLGVPAPPPWRIVLCGYVLHALNRPSDEIRRVPHRVTGVGEAIFPS